MQTHGTSNRGTRNRNGKSRQNRTRASKPQIESIQLKFEGDGYVYEIVTKAGVPQTTTSFKLSDAGKKLNGLKAEYAIPAKTWKIAMTEVRRLQNEQRIDDGVATKLASIAANGEIVNIDGVAMFLVPASALTNGGEIVFGDEKLVLTAVPVDAQVVTATSDDAKPEKKAAVVSTGNGAEARP